MRHIWDREDFIKETPLQFFLSDVVRENEASHHNLPILTSADITSWTQIDT